MIQPSDVQQTASAHSKVTTPKSKGKKKRKSKDKEHKSKNKEHRESKNKKKRRRRILQEISKFVARCKLIK